MATSLRTRLRRLRRFVREVVHPSSAGAPTHHVGHDLADEVREVIGPQAGGGAGGRLTGSRVYRLLEKERGV